MNILFPGVCGAQEEDILADKLGIYTENTLMVVIILEYDFSKNHIIFSINKLWKPKIYNASMFKSFQII